MKQRSHYEREFVPRTAVVAPFNERIVSDDTIPDWLSPEVKKQVAEHEAHYRAIASVVDALPHNAYTIRDAYHASFISPEQIVQFYESLTTLVSQEDSRRLALYLPFEWLPASDWFDGDASLTSVAERFRSAYADAWWELLRYEDVRANYTDGDVSDQHLIAADDLPRVVKAAHLLPWLIERTIVSRAEAEYIRDNTDSPVLARSLNEGLLAHEAMNATDNRERTLPTIDEIKVVYDKEMKSAACETDTAARTKWLGTNIRDQLVARYGHDIGTAAAGDGLIEQLLQSKDPLLLSVAVEAIGHAIRSAPDTLACYRHYGRALDQVVIDGGEALYERTASVMQRLVHDGKVSPVVLADHGVHTTALRGSQLHNLLQTQEMAALNQLIYCLRSDEALNAHVYPLLLVGGSVVKGYGSESSDTDLTIVIRPGTPEDARQTIRDRLRAIAPGYDPTELWLDMRADGQLGIKEFTSTDPHLGSKWWTHVLFNSVWLGSTTEIDMLQAGLLPAYFHDSHEGPYGQFARRLYLERIEQDVLQYRLLHKGYARMFFTDTPTTTEAIDGESVFYDSGYRLLASRLFLEKVWLPKQ